MSYWSDTRNQARILRFVPPVGQKTTTRPPKLRNAIGPALRAAREEKGLSQAELAAKLQLYGWDVGRTTWTKIELGERTITDCELLAVADVLSLNLDALAAGADPAAVKRVLRALRR